MYIPCSNILYNIPNSQCIIRRLNIAVTNLKYEYKITILNNITINIIQPNKYLSNDIIQQIYTSMKKVYIISIIYKEQNFNNICIYTYTHNNLNTQFLNAIIERILVLCELLQNINIPKITIYMLDLPKKINFINEFINSKNNSKKIPFQFTSDIINSGYYNIYTNEIIIFRNEEVQKVLLHELIHFHKLDYYYERYSLPINIINIIKHHYNLSSYNDYQWNESKSEALAIIINLYILNKNLKYAKIQSKIQSEINKNIDWNMFQMAKILLLITKDNILDKKYKKIGHNLGTQFHNILSNLNQTTCVFNYYFLKTLLLLQDSNLLQIKNIEQYKTMFCNNNLLIDGIQFYLTYIINNIFNIISHKQIHKNTKKTIQINSKLNLALNSMCMTYI